MSLAAYVNGRDLQAGSAARQSKLRSQPRWKTASLVKHVRSKSGCTNCRKRKVKCSEERPTCSHCHRLDLSCTYSITAPCSTKRDVPKPSQEAVEAETRGSGVPTFGTPSATSSFIDPNFHQASNEVVPGTSASSTKNAQDAHAYNRGPSDHNPVSWHMISDSQSFQLPENLASGLIGWDDLSADLCFETQSNMPENASFDLGMPWSISSNLLPASYPPDTVNTGVATGADPPMQEAASIVESQMTVKATLPKRNTSFGPEVLLKSFTQFTRPPPILADVEPGWSAARDSIIQAARSSKCLQNAICAFTDMTLTKMRQKDSAVSETCMGYHNLAVSELLVVLDSQDLAERSRQFYEEILATIFFLSYFELASSTSKLAAELLRHADKLVRTSGQPLSDLGSRLAMWLKVLDAKFTSGGGAGDFLVGIDISNMNKPGEESYTEDGRAMVGENDVQHLDMGMLLLDSIIKPAHTFYSQLLSFSGRIARIDRWHRSRGSIDDEFEVFIAARKIADDLETLWRRRPAIMKAWDQAGLLRPYLSEDLIAQVVESLRTYMANFHACFIHLHRVAYPHLPASARVQTATTAIVDLSKLSAAENKAPSANLLWPLMLTACELQNVEARDWIISRIESMNDNIGNANWTVELIKEIFKRQEGGRRVDARAVMQEELGVVFAIL